MGTGTLRIIEKAKEHGLPEPTFQDQGYGFSIVLRKEFITDEMLAVLNNRQTRAIQSLKENKSITNSQYQTIYQVSKPTATRDLQELVKPKIIVIVAVGKDKRDIKYIFGSQ